MINADLNSIKVEIVKKVLDSSDSSILDSIHKMLSEAKGNNGTFKLSETEISDIEISRKQIAEGKTMDWEDLKKKLG
jgi:RNA-splicing ligase RtcB